MKISRVAMYFTDDFMTARLLFPILKENHKDTWGNDNKLEATSTSFGKTRFRFISYLDKRPVIF